MVKRREFIRYGCLACAGILAACSSKDEPTPAPANFMIDLSDAGNAALKNVGGAVIKSGIIVIRRSSSAYVALSTTCTHASCTVNYSANSGRLVCPCHGSVFSNTGSVVQGPASRALPAYKVTVVGNNLTVTT